MIKNGMCSIVLVLCVIVKSAAQTTAPTTRPIPPRFLIGVWYQPIDSFAKWKARGINTLVGFESNGNTVTRAQWMAAARQAGFSYICKPTGDPNDAKADAADPNLLAWEQPDEPDGAGNTPAATIVNNYKAWKALGPHMPVFVNFDGAHSQYEPDAEYQQYCQGGDWISFDYYVINRGEGPGAIPKIGERLDKFKLYAGNDPHKKFFVFIECSNQDLNLQPWTQANDATGTPLGPKMRAPTATEMSQEIQQAIDHGANGIIYFPDKIGAGWEGFDGTTPDLEAVMKQYDAQLTAAATTMPALVHPTTSPAARLDGKEIIIDGVPYLLQKK